MNDYRTPPDFVNRVMEEVREYERDKRKSQAPSWPFIISVSTAGGLLGVINLIRLYFTVFSYVSCK